MVSTTRAPHGASFGNLKMDLVVEVPGVPPFAHGYQKLVTPVAKWPYAGQVLPVTIDPDDHDDVDIDWDAIPKSSDVAHDRAEQLAAALRGETQPAATDAGGVLQSIQQMFPGATVSAPGGMHVVAGQSGGDPVERLEKLAKLRAAGIIDDSQFEQLRAQILGQAGVTPE